MSQNDTHRNEIRRLLSEIPARAANIHVVGTLAWADAIERLDILVMEIRHIQSNIAQLLRKPRLLNLLRYEEIFIWGTVGEDDERARAKKGQALPDWIDLFGMLDNAPDCLAQLSSFFVLPIDSRSKRREGVGFEDVFMLERYRKPRLQLIEDVSSDVAASLYSSWLKERPHPAQWGQEHRRNYHLFRALQRMKRNLVLAKLQLCWWGAWAYRLIGNDGAPSIDKKRLAHFMAVRAGVMDKLANAVARLGDLQSQFERALDLGPQEITRPLGGRRRHGALTAAFLHNRSPRALDRNAGAPRRSERRQTDVRQDQTDHRPSMESQFAMVQSCHFRRDGRAQQCRRECLTRNRFPDLVLLGARPGPICRPCRHTTPLRRPCDRDCPWRIACSLSPVPARLPTC